MPYLNLDLDYFEHPKVKRLVGLLGKGSEVLTLRLWCYCGKYHKEDGRLAGYSTQEIESIAGWWGKQGEMVDAMVKIRVIDVIGGEYQMHNWMEHEGHLPALSIRAKKGAEARWAKLRGEEIPEFEKKETVVSISDATSNATSNAQASPKQCPYPSFPSMPNQSKPAVAESGTVHVPVQPKAPLPPEGIDPLILPEDQYSARDGTSLKAYFLHVWGADARRMGGDIFNRYLALGMNHGWEKLYYAIDEAASHDAKTLAYVTSIVDPSQRVTSQARKEKSWEEEFVSGLK